MSVTACCRVQITPMSMADYPEVIAFWTGKQGVGMSDSDSPEQVAQFLQRNPGLSLVARQSGKIIGAVLCGHDGRRAMLYHLAVDPAHQRQGLGRQLVERCVDALAAQSIQKCNIIVFGDNTEGQRFWNCLGFSHRADLRFMQCPLPAPKTKLGASPKAGPKSKCSC
jgi:N-acetylglutamate synthase